MSIKSKHIIGTLLLIAVFATTFMIYQLDIRNWQKLDVSKLTNSNIKTTIYNKDGVSVLVLGSNTNQKYITLSELPDYVCQAFIAAEDTRFYSHNGIDFKRIIAAAAANLRSASYSQGASTITQQLIKLTHLSSEKTLARKAQEAYLAIQLEKKWSKDMILEVYINTVYFGGGAYGINAAADRFFSKSASELTLPEAAMLAGIIKSPTNYAPHNNAQAALDRRDYVIKSMLDCGYINEKEAAISLSSEIKLQESIPSSNSTWYTDQVCTDSCNLLGITYDELIGGGYSIYTCLDSEMQSYAEKTMSLDLFYPDQEAQGAMVAINPIDGGVIAVVGGRNYTTQLGLNRASSIKRQPGSLIKPLTTYAAAVESFSLLPSSTVYDIQREYNGYMPGNAGGKYYGAVTMRFALAKSLNAATVDLADTVGVARLVDSLKKFGISYDKSDNTLALALGAMTHGVSPVDMCAAYAALANEGIYNKPYLIKSIYDRHGKLIYSHKPESHQAISTRGAYIISDMLKTTVKNGTAKALSDIGIPLAAKTGTSGLTNGDTSDAWASVYSPEIALTVWIGKDSNSSGGMSPSVTGGGYAVPACAAFINSISHKLTGSDFTLPSSLCRLLIDSYTLENHSRTVLAVSETPAAYAEYEIFDAGTILPYSDIWTAPPHVTDLKIVSNAGSSPVLQFTGTCQYADYIIIRKCKGVSETIGTVECTDDENISFCDSTADLSQINTYTVIPRNKLLYDNGITVTGTESSPVEYTPAGLLNGMASVLETTPENPVIESFAEPLF